MKAQVIEFLRPTFIALVGFGLVAGVGNLTFLKAPRPEEQAGPEGLLPGEAGRLDLGSVVLPRPDLAPGEVVRLQLAGLSDQKADGVGILQCYCFASPANRAVTGPLERFVFMQARPVPAAAGGVDVQFSYRCWPEDRYTEVRAAIDRLARSAGSTAVYPGDPFPALSLAEISP